MKNIKIGTPRKKLQGNTHRKPPPFFGFGKKLYLSQTLMMSCINLNVCHFYLRNDSKNVRLFVSQGALS